MRKYFLGVVAIIIAMSLSAFTSIKKSVASENAIPLYWFEYNLVTGTGIYLDYGVREDFTAESCHLATFGPDCRRGYLLTALVNQTDPNLGVINDDLNQDRIKKHE